MKVLNSEFNSHTGDSYLGPFRGRHSEYTPSATVPGAPPQSRQCWCNSPTNTSATQFTLLYRRKRQCENNNNTAILFLDAVHSM